MKKFSTANLGIDSQNGGCVEQTQLLDYTKGRQEKNAERCGVVRYVGDGDGLNKKGLSLQYQRINLAGNFGQSII